MGAAVMANCHAQFVSFEYEITPSIDELECCLEARRSTRRAVAAHCAAHNVLVRFYPEDLFGLLTAVRPNGIELNDSVLFNATDFNDRPDEAILGEMIVEALRDAAVSVSVSGGCVRVLYASGVRVGIVPYLSGRMVDRTDGRVATRRKFAPWFGEPINPQAVLQMSRLIKYCRSQAGCTAPLTSDAEEALAELVTTFYSPDDRDDVSLTATARSVAEHLLANRRPSPAASIGAGAARDRSDPGGSDTLSERFRDIAGTGEAALSCDDLQTSVELWQDVFGERFGTLDGHVTPLDRGWWLRRLLEDFEGLSIRRFDGDAVR